MTDPLISKITTSQDVDRNLAEIAIKIASNLKSEKDRCISDIEAEIRRRLKELEDNYNADVSKPIYPIVTVLTTVPSAVLDWLDRAYTDAGYAVFYTHVRPNFRLPFQTLFALTTAGTMASPFTDTFIESLIGSHKEMT